MTQKKLKIAEVMKDLDRRAPVGTAEAWDNVGLLAGDPEWITSAAVVSIDFTAASLAAAKKCGARLIVTHHPCIFPRNRGLSRIVPGAEGSITRLLVDALGEGIAVAASHTNFDRCALEVVDAISKGLGIVPKGRLLEEAKGSLKKLVVFVPETHVEAVRQAVCGAGAGQVGQYDQCTFGTSGEGTFRGGAGTSPFLGKPGRRETTGEVRLETVLPAGMERPVLKALFESHPYEEVAFDLYSLEQEPSGQGIVRGLGYGFWGEFPKSQSFSEVTRGVRSLFKVDGFWMTEGSPSRVKRVAFVAGKGAGFLGAARSAGCELFITGEAGYHTALDGWRQGLTVMELGHRESELFFVKTMSSWLSQLGLRTVESNLPTQRILLGDQK